MATPISLFVLLLLLCSSSIVAQYDDFSYNGFNQSNLKLVGATVPKPSGALRLTDKTQKVIGHAFYPKPIRFRLNTSSSNPNKTISSFSTHFVFQIVPSGSKRGGHGLAFTVSPAMEFPGAEAEHYLGILSEATINNSSNHLFAVEFDTVNGFNDTFDEEGNHVGVNINTMWSVEKELAFYYDGDDKEEITLESGYPIQAWVDYNGSNRVLNVTIAPTWKRKPIRPLISKVIDLSPVFLEDMYVGFSAATGDVIKAPMSGQLKGLYLRSTYTWATKRIITHKLIAEVTSSFWILLQVPAPWVFLVNELSMEEGFISSSPETMKAPEKIFSLNPIGLRLWIWVYNSGSIHIIGARWIRGILSSKLSTR